MTPKVRYHLMLEHAPYWRWDCDCGATGVLIASEEEAQREATDHICSTVGCQRCGAPLAGPQSAMAGVQIQGAYDGVLFWECMVCGFRWHRFEEGSLLWQKARPYVAGGGR